IENFIQAIEENDDPKIIEKLPQFYADEEKKLANFISNSWSKQIRHEIAPLIKITKRPPSPQPLNSQQEQATSSIANNNINRNELKTTSVRPTYSSRDSSSYSKPNQQYSGQTDNRNYQPRPNQDNRSSRLPIYHQPRSIVYKNIQQENTTGDFSKYSNYHFNMSLQF
ncbi:unnamed protein product, partial [Didymodactylos carnosus]